MLVTTSDTNIPFSTRVSFLTLLANDVFTMSTFTTS